jgi:hypothetical protein
MDYLSSSFMDHTLVSAKTIMYNADMKRNVSNIRHVHLFFRIPLDSLVWVFDRSTARRGSAFFLSAYNLFRCGALKSKQYGSTETPMEARNLRTTWSGIRAMDYPHRVVSCLGRRPLQDRLSSVLLEFPSGHNRLGISRGAKVEASYNTSSLACLRLHLRQYPPTLSAYREVTTQNIAKT